MNDDTTPATLSPREKEVACLRAQGLTTREIAERFGLADKTVKAHQTQIYRKLGIHNTALLTLHAVREGWIRIEHKSSAEGHPWQQFLHHRARVIDWLYAGSGNPDCKLSDEAIARVLSVDTSQVFLIRTRDRALNVRDGLAQ